ncbi:ABC transporter ATP-binding protein [Sporolactobacillus sp. KGMB 08714]|uniref:ABC transporter ATP-binding protein n=1 Tax=Sporolactobacillus sp. KGMB 08714 TaxID=3064704 RepID=UPI002FBD97D1
MNYLKTYWKKYRLKFVIAIVFLAGEALADLMQPALMAQIVDKGVARSDTSLIIHFGLLMLLITFLGAICASVRNVLSVDVSQKFALDLRQDLYIKIQGFSQRNIDRFTSGTLITRLTNDVTRVQTFANGLMRVMMKAPIVGIGSLLMAIRLNPRLSVTLAAIVPIIALLIYLNMKISYPFYRNVQSALDHVNMSMQEYLSGVRVVKVFSRFSYEEKRFRENSRSLGNLSTSAAKVGSLFGPLVNLTVNSGIIAIIWFGGIGVNNGTMQVGSIIAFINYMMQILFAIMVVNNAFNMFVRARASAERIGEVMREKNGMRFPDSVSEGRSESAVDAQRGRLVFRHVSFSYVKNAERPQAFLKDISFTVNPGETVGIIGPIASGKTTLVNLLLRFYDPDRGEILLDGRNIKTYSEDRLRRKLAVVPQKSLLFSGSVRENIRWGDERASDEAILEAAVAAEADGFIRHTPRGYDAIIGQGGVNFSGGQKQRIAIARALIRRPEILILDDATSAVDARTDRKIRTKLKSLADRPACIIISQRIASLIDADKIIVIDNGKIEAIGTHERLLKTSALYREIYGTQFEEEGNENG